MPRGATRVSIASLDPALLAQVHEYVDSNRHHSAAHIHRQFDLVSRGIKLDTFIRYVARRRGSARAARHEVSLLPQAAADTYQRAMGVVDERLRAGDVKGLDAIASLLRAMHDRMRLNIEDAIEKRAAELHEAKLAEVRRRQASALETVEQAERLTPEQVAAIRQQVLGL